MAKWVCPGCRKSFEIPEGWENPKFCADCRELAKGGPPKAPVPPKPVKSVSKQEVTIEIPRKKRKETPIPLKYTVSLFVAHAVTVFAVLISGVCFVNSFRCFQLASSQEYVTHQTVALNQGLVYLLIGFGLFVSAEFISLFSIAVKKLVQIEICARGEA